MNPTIESSIELIRILHEGQFDWSGEPYSNHPIAVMMGLPSDVPDEYKHIALLHDVVEDCKHKFSCDPYEFLKYYGYSEYVLEGVKLLTRTPDVKYLDEIRHIVASGHLGAMYSKLSDNYQNSSQKRYDNLKSDENRAKAISMRPRYEKSKSILRDGLIALGHDVSWSF